jgi:thiamine biosynthesis protein ThiI
MKSIIYIKYGELTLKGKNKINFINCLFDNVKRVLLPFNKIQIIKQFDALIIKGMTSKNHDNVITILKRVPGIDLIIPAFECSKIFTKLANNIVKELQKRQLNKTTFKVNSKRADKTYPLNSMELSAKMGGVVLDNFKKYSVDVHKPQLLITIEIRHTNAIFYFEKIKGMGGFPLGINGKVLMLISGGIDSPVASYLLLKKGLHVDFLTFISPPHTDERAVDKVRQLRKILTLDHRLYKSRLAIVNFTSIQHEISHIPDHSYQITIMRRFFFKIAQKLALDGNYQAIATGESLGQVASQTIQSMQTIQNAIGDFLVLRPLLTMDKSEIIKLAKEIGTFETSILPYADACSLFVPANPVTKPTIHKAQKLEESLTLIKELLENLFQKHIAVE